MSRTYLAVFLLPKPRPEHKQLADIIKDVSNGDCKAAFVGSGCIGYLFKSHLMPWQISFSKVLFNDDSSLIIEVGETFSHQNLRAAENWLKAHAQK